MKPENSDISASQISRVKKKVNFISEKEVSFSSKPSSSLLATVFWEELWKIKKHLGRGLWDPWVESGLQGPGVQWFHDRDRAGSFR